MMSYRMTKTERIARRNFARDWYVLDQMSLPPEELRAVLPREWHLLEWDVDVTEKKEKVTLYLDQSVARMMKAQGAGYQGLVNRILRCWVQAKMGQLLELESHLEERRTEVIEAHGAARGQPRPGWDEDVADWAEDEARVQEACKAEVPKAS